MMCTSKRAVMILLLPASLREVGMNGCFYVLYLRTLAVGCCLIEFFFLIDFSYPYHNLMYLGWRPQMTSPSLETDFHLIESCLIGRKGKSG